MKTFFSEPSNAPVEPERNANALLYLIQFMIMNIFDTVTHCDVLLSYT